MKDLAEMQKAEREKKNLGKNAAAYLSAVEAKKLRKERIEKMRRDLKNVKSR